jgi:hypothetical protein
LTTSSTKKRFWFVEDVRQVPDRYCEKYVVGGLVDLAVDNGISEIPGIRIVDEEEVKE